MKRALLTAFALVFVLAVVVLGSGLLASAPEVALKDLAFISRDGTPVAAGGTTATQTGEVLFEIDDWSQVRRIGYADGPPTSVTTAVPPGWPSPNALEISFNATGASLYEVTGWPLPRPGEAIFYRFILYNDFVGTAGQDHGMQSTIGDAQHGFIIGDGFGETPDPTNEFAFALVVQHPGGPAADVAYINMRLPKREILLVEWGFRLETGLRAIPGLRVTSLTSQRAWTEDDFRAEYGAGVSLADAGAVEFTSLDLAYQRYYFGASGSGLDGSRILIGAFAVCDDWCGPFAGGAAR